MLALVKRTGTEFGIAVIVASHLLGEIERVCDFLVAIEAGRLLRAAPLATFTSHTGVLAVEVEDGRDALAAALTARGVRTRLDGRAILIAADGSDPVGAATAPTVTPSGAQPQSAYDIVRDTVVELGLPLLRLEHRRHSLEDLFRETPLDEEGAEDESVVVVTP
jgi:ABC-2 type transport system ATP-binding protein